MCSSKKYPYTPPPPPHLLGSELHLRILISKYVQTDSMRPLTANRGFPFAVRWPNLDLKVSNNGD